MLYAAAGHGVAPAHVRYRLLFLCLLYGSAEVGLHGECFLALGCELQLVDLTYPVYGGCAQPPYSCLAKLCPTHCSHAGTLKP